MAASPRAHQQQTDSCGEGEGVWVPVCMLCFGRSGAFPPPLVLLGLSHVLTSEIGGGTHIHTPVVQL